MLGSVITWDNTTPAGTESIGLGDDRIRSLKSAVQTAMDDEHIFPSSGGTAGLHRLGAARAYVGTQSRVSASTTSANAGDGRLMVASDTSNLFGVGSGGTQFFGGPKVLSFGSHLGVTFPQRKFIAVEAGVADPDANGRYVVTFPNSGFSELPVVYLQSMQTYASGPQGLIPTLYERSTSDFSAVIYRDSGGTAATTNVQLAWIAIGSRAL